MNTLVKPEECAKAGRLCSPPGRARFIMTGLRLSRIWQCSILRARPALQGGLFPSTLANVEQAIRRGLFRSRQALGPPELSCRASFRWMRSQGYGRKLPARPADWKFLFMAPCATAFRAVATGQAILAAKRFCADAACSPCRRIPTSASLTMPKRRQNAVANGKKTLGAKPENCARAFFLPGPWNWACWQKPCSRCPMSPPGK